MTQYGVSAGMPGELPSDADLPVMSLESSSLKAEAGGQAQTTLTLRNPGHLVESFRLDVVGLDDGWWQVHPPELALYPGEDASAVVVLTPPAAARAPDRPLPFGVRAISTLDPSRGVVEEGDLEIGRVFDLQPSISPVTSRARWSARHTITFTNWGNSPVRLKLSASDKDGRLGFQLDPDAVVVPVGGRATARLRVRPSDPFLRGTPVHLPFQVRGEQPGAAPVGPRSVAQRAGVPDPTTPVVDGAVLHGPILSKGVVMTLIAAVAALAAAVALLFRAGDVQGARNADTAPPAPTAVSVSALSDSIARVAWTGNVRALAYKVRTIDETGAPLKSDDVKGDVLVYDAKLEPPKADQPKAAQACFEVYAVRGDFVSKASERKCLTLPDTTLKPPTDVKVDQSGAQYRVSWQGQRKNTHTVLVDQAGALPNAEIAAGLFSALIDVPAGHHCIAVLAKRGEDQISQPSAEQCVDSTGPPATPTAGTGGNGGVLGGTNGQATPTQSTGTGPTTGATGSTAPVAGIIAALGGPKQSDDNVAKSLVADLNNKGIPARIVPGTAVPNHPDAPFENPATILVVVENFPSLQAAQDFCTNTVLPANAQPCTPIQAGA